jgi:hypothetical protein
MGLNNIYISMMLVKIVILVDWWTNFKDLLLLLQNLERNTIFRNIRFTHHYGKISVKGWNVSDTNTNCDIVIVICKASYW